MHTRPFLYVSYVSWSTTRFLERFPSLSVTTTASLALTGTSVSQALESVNDSCPQLSWGRNCRNKFQIQPAFRKPTATGKFSLHCLWKKNKDPNLHHRTRCSASLMQEWQLKWKQEIKSHQSILRRPQTLKAGEPEERGHLYTIGRRAQWQHAV